MSGGAATGIRRITHPSLLFATTTNLIIGNNVITHNLNLTQPQYYFLQVRDNFGAEVVTKTLPLQDLTNSLTIKSTININNVRVIIKGIS